MIALWQWLVPERNEPSFLKLWAWVLHFFGVCSQLLLQRNESLRNWLNSYSQIQVELKAVGILAAEQAVSLTRTFRPCSSHPCLDHFKIMIQKDFLWWPYLKCIERLMLTLNAVSFGAHWIHKLCLPSLGLWLLIGLQWLWVAFAKWECHQEGEMFQLETSVREM